MQKSGGKIIGCPLEWCAIGGKHRDSHVRKPFEEGGVQAHWQNGCSPLAWVEGLEGGGGASSPTVNPHSPCGLTPHQQPISKSKTEWTKMLLTKSWLFATHCSGLCRLGFLSNQSDLGSHNDRSHGKYEQGIGRTCQWNTQIARYL